VPAHLDRGWIRGQDTALLVHHDKRVRESLVDRSSDPDLLGGRLVLAFGLLGDDCLLPAPDCCIRSGTSRADRAAASKVDEIRLIPV
jgi:hypothetical protein